ncbi:hypothetical protein BD770DRAFT_425634 [Pilaira anomala]|nr:hypothetical protein BD770DRAFT_425634 [Pilaira anomala]
MVVCVVLLVYFHIFLLVEVKKLLTFLLNCRTFFNGTTFFNARPLFNARLFFSVRIRKMITKREAMCRALGWMPTQENKKKAKSYLKSRCFLVSVYEIGKYAQGPFSLRNQNVVVSQIFIMMNLLSYSLLFLNDYIGE